MVRCRLNDPRVLQEIPDVPDAAHADFGLAKHMQGIISFKQFTTMT
jgi:hypothetical protein